MWTYRAEVAKGIVNRRYEKLRERYPKTVLAAYHLILSYLALHDPNKLACFKGECAVDYKELEDLLFAFFGICDILEEERLGNPNVTPIAKEVMFRKYLNLPPLVLEGGKPATL